MGAAAGGGQWDRGLTPGGAVGLPAHLLGQVAARKGAWPVKV